MRTVAATITAENTFTDAFQATTGQRVSLSIKGNAFSGTIVLQRKFNNQSTWQDVADSAGTVGWSTDFEGTYVVDESCDLRLGAKTGGFGGTSADCRLGIG